MVLNLGSKWLKWSLLGVQELFFLPMIYDTLIQAIHFVWISCPQFTRIANFTLGENLLLPSIVSEYTTIYFIFE